MASFGHRRRIAEAIAALREGSELTSVSGATSGPESGAEPQNGAERRQLTVMFVDLVGSSGLAEGLDPEDLRVAVRSYQDACAGVIARFGGFVAKYLGDGVLAYFGWPRTREDEAQQAVEAALAVVEAVAELRAPGGRPLAARVGIATGLVVVGDLLGEGAAREEAVVGETPNLAARLQQLAEPSTVVVADATRRLLGGLFEAEDLGKQPVRGFAAPVQVWRVLSERQVEGRFEAQRAGAGVPPADRAHRGVGLHGRGIDPDPLALDQAVLGQPLQHPGEHLLVHFQRQPRPGPAQPGVIRHPLVEPEAEEVPQREAVGAAPFQPRSLAIPSK